MKAKIIGTASALAIGLFLAGTANAQSGNGVGNSNNDINTNSFNNYEDLLDIFLTDQRDQSQFNANQKNQNNNTYILAHQILKAVNYNRELDEVVDLDGQDDANSNVGYNSGNNRVSDSAFAAFAGINNMAWNTGINANTQAATNIAAQGTVSFGAGDGAGAVGGGGGDED